MRCVASVCLGVLLSASVAVADDADISVRCAPYEIPIDLVFTTVTPEPAVHTTATVEDIKSMARARGGEDSELHPFGVTVSETLLALDSKAFALRSRSARDGGECIYLDKVEVTFGWQAHDIYVANNLNPGECFYEAVLRHEEQHAAINTAVLLEFAPRIKAVLEEALAREAPVFQKVTGTAVRDAIHRLDNSANDILASFQLEKARRNAVIDTAESRRATTRSCDDAKPARPRVRFRDGGVYFEGLHR